MLGSCAMLLTSSCYAVCTFGGRSSVAVGGSELLQRKRRSRAAISAKGVYAARAVAGFAYQLVVVSWDLHSR